MSNIEQVWLKYHDQSLLNRLDSLDDVNRLALTFSQDVARTYRFVTIRGNASREPFGYGLAEAPIVGLLTRVAKLLRLICKFYKRDTADHLAGRGRNGFRERWVREGGGRPGGREFVPTAGFAA